MDSHNHFQHLLEVGGLDPAIAWQDGNGVINYNGDPSLLPSLPVVASDAERTGGSLPPVLSENHLQGWTAF